MFLSVCLTLRKKQKQATSKSLPIIEEEGKKIYIYYYVSSTSDSWSNDLDNQQFDKRHKTKKKSVEATIKNKEIEKRLSSTLMQLSLLV